MTPADEPSHDYPPPAASWNLPARFHDSEPSSPLSLLFRACPPPPWMAQR